MPIITRGKTKPAYDVIVVGTGAAGGQSAYVLAMGGAKVLMLEAGRNYDPVMETPMFSRHDQAPLRAAGTPDKPFGFYDATVDGGWTVPKEPYLVRRARGGAGGAESKAINPATTGQKFSVGGAPPVWGGPHHWGRSGPRLGPYAFQTRGPERFG